MINKLYNENCLETLKRMPSELLDMVLTSPPYDNLRKYDGFEFDFEAIAEELVRVLKPDGVIVWIVGDATIGGSETGTSFRQALHFMKLGLKLHDTMIYEKNGATYPAKANGNRYTNIFEYMFVLAKGTVQAELIKDKPNKWAGHKDWSKKLSNPVPTHSPRNNIWRYKTAQNPYNISAPFPEQLVRDHLLTWSRENALVYDPFMGTGTVALECVKLNRQWIGSEISPRYAAIIEQRLAELGDRLW